MHSHARKLEQRLDVAIVSRCYGVQISGSGFTRFDEVGGAPSECGTAALHYQHIRHQAGKVTHGTAQATAFSYLQHSREISASRAQHPVAIGVDLATLF